jgi:protein TonB
MADQARMWNLALQRRLMWSGSFLAAIAAHAALALPLWRGREALAGAGGLQLDVISVTMVSPGVLESRESDPTKLVAPAAAEAVETNDGAPELEPQRPKTKEREAEKKPDEEPRTADAVLEVNPEVQKQTERPSSVPGAAAARGEMAKENKARGAVAASAGAIREYARSVQQSLAKTKPKGLGARGTVKVKFEIGMTGRLNSSEVIASSGNATLDRTALDAVRRALFPAPPPGMSSAQLTYEIPYRFR